ncbi:MAG: polyphosphate polymerase domain-containing protein [Clostridiales bacterium]|nr:polyphosphate polymerase domain-containing protein [Clostridiales bacterium]
MAAYQSVFRRIEKKYLLTRQQYEKLRHQIDSMTAPDKFEKSTICNIYFDTPNYQLIRRSLEKPIFKEKLRLRSYGVPSADSNVFVELKRKCKGIVYKRRAGMTYSEATHYLKDGTRPHANPQIINEINWFIHFYQELQPAMFISYERVARVGKENPNLRITFDSNILWRTEKLSLEQGIWGTPLLQPDEYLMEIKIPGAMPLWLSRALNELNIFPTSYSKYGNAYKLLFHSERNKGGVKSA